MYKEYIARILMFSDILMIEMVMAASTLNEKTIELKYTLDLSLLGSDPTPSGAIVCYKEVEVVWALVVLVSIFLDRLFFPSIMKRLMYVGCTFSAFTDWLQTRAISSNSNKQLNQTYLRGFSTLSASCILCKFELISGTTLS